MGAWIEIPTSLAIIRYVSSRPAWARGLKSCRPCGRRNKWLSRPAWARGLKFAALGGESLNHLVAPRVGAWIEMPRALHSPTTAQVAPRVGAWIEILSISIMNRILSSRPAWARGLK